MTDPVSLGLVAPEDDLPRQNAKLARIAEVLMARVERVSDSSGAAYAQFQRAALLEEEVRSRTRDLEHALDLVNRSNAEAELARRNLAGAIEVIREGFALFDRDGRLRLWNSRFGMSVPDICAALRPGLGFDEYVDVVAASGALMLPPGRTRADWAAERRASHQGGHAMFDVELTGDRWVQVSERLTPTGQTVVMQSDVTDIIRAERAVSGAQLDAQARLIRATLEHLDQGVCIFDAQHRLIGWNRQLARLLMVPMEDLRTGVAVEPLWRRLAEGSVIEDGLRTGDVARWVTRRSGRAPLRFSLRRTDPGGGTRVLAVFAEETPDAGLVISFRDVTAERRATEMLQVANETLERRIRTRTLDLEDALAEAERANATKSRFVAAASHDLMQPLSAAKLLIGSVQEDVPAGAADRLEKALGAIQSVEEIIEALLDISRLEAGGAAPDVMRAPLAPILGEIEDQFMPAAALAGLSLRVLPTSLAVETDAFYLRRILRNLVANAIRYTETGKVVVGVRRTGASARIEVHDSGPGIPESRQEEAFRPFTRLGTRASAAEGMGLGLAIVERACAILAHPLELRSTVGRGTSFLLTVPLAGSDHRPIPGAPRED